MKKFKLFLLAGIALLSLWSGQAFALSAKDTHWTGVTPNAAVSYGNNCYLYNVGTGKWLGRGGRWGTEAVQSDVALAVKVLNKGNGTYQLQTTMQAQQTTTPTALIALTDATAATDDWYTYYIDRQENRTGNANGDGSLTYFTFTPVANQVNNGNAASNVYQISTSSSNSDTKTVDNQTFTLTSGTYYMCGHYNAKSSDALRSRQDNCINGFISSDATALNDNSDQWIIVTEQQYRDYFQTAQAAYTDPAPGTFLMHDEDFGRNDNAVTNWKRANGSDLLLGDNLATDNQHINGNNFVHVPTDATGTKTVITYNTSDVSMSTGFTSGNIYVITDGNNRFLSLNANGNIVNNTTPESATQWTVTSSDGLYYFQSNGYYLSVNTNGLTTSSTQEDASAWTYDSSYGFANNLYTYTYYNTHPRLTYNNGWTITSNVGNAKLQTVTSEETTTTTTSYTYYVGNGLNNGSNEQIPTGDKWTANIHGASGKVYQTLNNLFREGWYRIKVNAWTTSAGSAKVYAKVGGATASSGELLSKYFEANIQSIATAPATYVDANDEVNKVRTLEDGTTGYQYQTSVMVYLPAADNNNFENIEFGIEVANGAGNAWTCFDNFQIEYLGDAQKVVVLDEDRTDIDYINNQNTVFANEHKANVILHRELNVNKWNSIVLPFDMDDATINSVFGAGTVYSQFKGAISKDHPNRLYFQTTSNGIKRGQLYLIKPTKDATALDKEESARDNGDDDTTVRQYTIKAGTKVYTIPGVSFAYYNGTEKQTFAAKVTGETGDETYGSDTKVQFVGTYVADAEGEKSIPANSYVIAYNNTANAEAGKWYYRTTTTHTKGFRGWLQYTGSAAKTGVQFVIDGVVSDDDAATAIEGLTTDKQVETRANGVYNLSGQLVRSDNSLEGLSKGIYIVNGRKVVVR